jgi:small-conductance mechanosensitive channel
MHAPGVVEYAFACFVAVCFALVNVPSVFAQQSPPPPVAAAPGTTPSPPATAPAPTATPPAPAPAAKPVVTLPPELIDPVNRLSRSIEAAEKSLQQLKEIESDLQRQRSNVEQIIYDSTAQAEILRPQLAEVKSQIEKLGPPPAKDQPAESAAVAAERARLSSLSGELDSALKTTELAWVKAKQLIDRITTMRYQIFTKNLFERRTSPIMPSVWRDVGDRMPTIISRTQYYGGDWAYWASRKKGMLIAMLSAIVAGGALFWFVSEQFIRRKRAAFAAIPSFFDRVASAAWVVPLRLIAPALVAILSYSALDNLELLFAPWGDSAEALVKGLLIYTGASILASTTLAPKEPEWRLLPVSDATARRLIRFVKLFIAVYIIDTVLVEFGRAIYVPLPVTVAQTFLTNIAFAAILLALVLTPFVPQTGPLRPVNGHPPGFDYLAGVTRHTPRWIKAPMWLVAALIIGTSLLGYVALGRFIGQQLVLSGTVLAVFGLFYLAIRAVTRGRGNERSHMAAVLEQNFGLDASRQSQITKLVEVALTFSLFLVALPVLLLQWGFAAADIRDWAKALFFGFEVGQFKISLVRILIGIVLFTALLFATRLIQRWLRDRVLAQSRMDSGVANSIDTAVGYGGIAMAALLSVSYAGFDITSLAIVAGALSVGIGFGLQSIVNNFVSGLILLVERPIKVGDWIVVGDQQGNVRRISVRSTEIETFDRASLIVPNSELISGRVLNWTHRNLLGRVIMKVSTEPHADADRVIRLLVEAAKAQPNLLKSPEPSASLDGFATDKLDFTLRATLADVNTGVRTNSDLRVAILKAFREANLIVSVPAAAPVEATTASAAPAQTAAPMPAAPQPQKPVRTEEIPVVVRPPNQERAAPERMPELTVGKLPDKKG